MKYDQKKKEREKKNKIVGHPKSKMLRSMSGHWEQHYNMNGYLTAGTAVTRNIMFMRNTEIYLYLSCLWWSKVTLANENTEIHLILEVYEGCFVKKSQKQMPR